ncbi:ATP-binding protein [Paraburkholderia sp. RL17-337-BIB-A]|uniref:ATP-binding protein n=1 Tax=Paraburkholderia sp. RL17-337-BIB-A TaxID=3031636 RepID=UPI0038BC8502
MTFRHVSVTVEDFRDSLTVLYDTRFNMGMELAVSSSIVEAHRGQIRASNNPGGGATFSFSLPPAHEGGGAKVTHAAGSVRSNPHSALGQLAPDQFRQLSQPQTGQPANL